MTNNMTTVVQNNEYFAQKWHLCRAALRDCKDNKEDDKNLEFLFLQYYVPSIIVALIGITRFYQKKLNADSTFENFTAKHNLKNSLIFFDKSYNHFKSQLLIDGDKNEPSNYVVNSLGEELTQALLSDIEADL